MAFNPFRAFRKHQKVWFAALTIMCMITFVLAGSSGVFSEVTGWFTGGGRSPQVAVLYGKPVYMHEITQVRQQRELANLFILNAVTKTNDATAQRLHEEIPKSSLSKQTQDQLTQQLFMRTLVLQNPQFAGGGRKQVLQYLDNMKNQIASLYGFLKTEEAKDAGILERMFRLLEQDERLLATAGQFYFGGSLDGQSILDFMIWQRQADRLGIQIAQPEIKTLLSQETQGRFTVEINKQVQLQLRNRYRDLRPEMLDRALAAEFRARLAQDAVLGYPVASYDQYLPSLTPYAFWNYYREQRTESTVAMLPIPVANPDFLGAVGEPIPEDLKSLYEKGKDQLYNPASPEAGFKQPTRISLEWVTADPDSAHYKRAAEFTIAATQAISPAAYDLALLSEYDKQRAYYIAPSWNNNYFQALHASSVKRPGNVAAAVGQALGVGSTHGPAALSGWMAYQGLAVHHEFQDRLRHERKMILSWMSGSPWVTAALAYEGAPKSEFLPLDEIKPFVVDKLKESVAQKLASNALEELQKDLRDVRSHFGDFPSARADVDGKRLAAALVFGHAMGPAGPLAGAGLAYQQEVELARARGRAASAFVLGNTSQSLPVSAAALLYRDHSLVVEELRKRVADAIDKYALRHGRAERMDDQYELGDDPGLAPLKPVVDKSMDFGSPESRAKSFGERVMKDVERGNVYDPHSARDWLTNTEFVYWKTKEQMEYVPPFDEVKDKVAQRWKFEKARALAQKEAEEIVKAIPKSTSGPDVERWLRDAKRADKPNEKTHVGPMFELEHVARLVRQRAAVQSSMPTGGYEPYKIPPIRVEYSSPEMVQKILDLKEPGEAVVLHDQPEATYYVATLIQRFPAYELAFEGDAKQPAILRTLLEAIDKDTQYREKQRQGLLDQLRAEALRNVNEDNLKRSSGSRDED